MIVVIADDFTGAAELAGLGLRYHLKTELAMPGVAGAGADLLLISTDSRSLSNKDAEMITAGVVKEVDLLRPGLVYKKIDSVLRGHVLDELKVQMKISGLRKALVLPANPSLGRTISGGRYYIYGKPINETGFATDPEFAITDPCVLHMIRAEGEKVKVLKHTDELPAAGIVIGEAESKTDMMIWAEKTGRDWLLAGAGDFFEVLLGKRYKESPVSPVVLKSPHLYVSGTAYAKSRAFIKKVNEERGSVAYLPGTTLQPGKEEEEWINEVTGILKQQGKAIVAIKENEVPLNISAASLREAMARVVKRIVLKESIKELFIEGGSTAAAILNELSIHRLTPVNELQRGVVRMKAKDIYITVKPGSYELPEQVLKLYSSK